MKIILRISLIVTVSLLFTGCTSSTAVVPEKSPSFKLGEKDGCATATGSYIKNSKAFNADKDYKDGWYYGRKNCNPAQKA